MDDPFVSLESDSVVDDESFFDLPPETELTSEAVYSPPPAPLTLEGAVDAAIVESALFPGEYEASPVEESSEAEVFDNPPEGESFGDVEGEDFGSEEDVAPEADGDLHETWDDDEEDFSADGDMHETWDDDDDAFDYDGDMHETWDN